MTPTPAPNSAKKNGHRCFCEGEHGGLEHGVRPPVDLGVVYVQQRPLLLAEARRRGFSAVAAEDLVQDFFAEALAKRYLSSYDASLSKLGSFVSLLFRRFLHKQRRRSKADKRGGGLSPLLLDEVVCRGLSELVDWRTPDVECECVRLSRSVDSALEILKQECVSRGKAQQYHDALPWLLRTRSESCAYEGLSQRWGVSRAAVKMVLSRLRRRLRALLASDDSSGRENPRFRDRRRLLRESMETLEIEKNVCGALPSEV